MCQRPYLHRESTDSLICQSWFTYIHLKTTYIAEYRCKVWIGSRNNKGNDIQVKNDCSQSNDVVKIRTGQTNKSVIGRIDIMYGLKINRKTNLLLLSKK